MKIGKGDQAKDYLPVQQRLVWVNELCPEIKIETVDKIIELDRETEEEVFQWNADTRRSEKVIKRANGWAYFEVRVTATDKDGHTKSAVGSKSEGAASFKDFIEKAQTGAIGRALAMIGYGTQFAGDEFNEAHRIVDAPVEYSQREQNGRGKEHDPLAKKREQARKMAQALGIKDPPAQMDEKALDNFIEDCKKENTARKQSQQKEAEARAELTK